MSLTHTLAAVLLLAGCTPPVQDARSAVDRLGQELVRLRAVVVAACSEPPLLPAEDCRRAQDSFNRLTEAYEVLREVTP